MNCFLRSCRFSSCWRDRTISSSSLTGSSARSWDSSMSVGREGKKDQVLRPVGGEGGAERSAHLLTLCLSGGPVTYKNKNMTMDKKSHTSPMSTKPCLYTLSAPPGQHLPLPFSLFLSHPCSSSLCCRSSDPTEGWDAKDWDLIPEALPRHKWQVLHVPAARNWTPSVAPLSTEITLVCIRLQVT